MSFAKFSLVEKVEAVVYHGSGKMFEPFSGFSGNAPKEWELLGGTYRLSLAVINTATLGVLLKLRAPRRSVCSHFINRHLRLSGLVARCWGFPAHELCPSRGLPSEQWPGHMRSPGHKEYCVPPKPARVLMLLITSRRLDLFLRENPRGIPKMAR